jgi:hypothetical protein
MIQHSVVAQKKVRFPMEHNSSSIFSIPLLFGAMALGVAAPVASLSPAGDLSTSGSSTCPHTTPIIIPESKLLHFDSPTRYPDAYMVVFKCDQALAARKEHNASNRSQVLPKILPTSQSNCAALASAFVARFGGKIRDIWCARPGVRGFNVNGITEAAIAALAKDDRVEFVEPDMYAVTE